MFSILPLVQQEDVEAVQAVHAAAVQAGHGWDAGQQVVLSGDTQVGAQLHWVDGAWLRRVLDVVDDQGVEGVERVERVRALLDAQCL